MTAYICAALALGALVLAPAVGLPAALALAAGFVAGAANGFAARRAVGSALPFRASSMGRIGVLTVVALAVGLALGRPLLVAWAAAGIALAQLVLAGTSIFSLVKR